MKHIAIIIASFLFSMLFFEKHIGLNLSLFSVLTIVFLYIYNPRQFSNKTIIVYSIAYVVTAVFVFINHSMLAIIANCAAFFNLVGVVSQSRTSIYVQWFNGMFTSIAGLLYRSIEADNETKKVSWKKDIDFIHLSKLVGIPLVFIILFIGLYKNGNPIFETIISKINFDFINIQWLLFTVLGYYLFSNISQPIQIEPTTSRDLNTSNNLFKSGNFSEEQLKKEQQIGITLLGLLNLLLLLYVVTDVAYLTTNTATAASALSNQVHNGINTLIASIIIAIIIIVFVFRGDLNFYKHNKNLKLLSYLWMALNVGLVVLIAIKNQNYITSFGLTYKRIGVHVYIFLTTVGLLTTFIKVKNIKNLVFLFRKNSQIAFIILVLGSAINWDYHITKYNLTSAKDFDIDYLIRLSDRNAILLHDFKDDITISNAHRNRIITKYHRYISELQQREWQELSYSNVLIDSETQISQAQ